MRAKYSPIQTEGYQHQVSTADVAAYGIGGKSAALASLRLRGRLEIFSAKRVSVVCISRALYCTDRWHTAVKGQNAKCRDGKPGPSQDLLVRYAYAG